MKCRETKYWLYSLRPNTSWPVDVVTHLQGCAKCQLIQARLKQIDIGVNALTSVPGAAESKARLLERLEHTPQQAVPALPRSAWPFVRFVGILTAAAALLVLGWFLGRGEFFERDPLDPVEKVKLVEVIKEKPVEVIREKIVKVESPGDRQLFAALLKRNARLVQAPQVKDRLEALLDMAADCRRHALTLIERGPRDSLPLTVDLYNQLLQIGVPAQLQQAPAEFRPVLQATTRIRLGQMAELPAGEPKALPRALEEQRDALQNSAREALNLIDRPVAAPAAPKKDQRALTPAAALVQFALAFSLQSEPVAKADVCAECVNRLLPYMMLCLAEDPTPERGDMGQQFGEMIRFGIYAPLAAMAAQEPPPALKDEVGRLYQNAAQTIAEMEKNMQTAPPATKANFNRMLEATQKGQKKSSTPPPLRSPQVR